jgi:hypothetical protein
MQKRALETPPQTGARHTHSIIKANVMNGGFQLRQMIL